MVDRFYENKIYKLSNGTLNVTLDYFNKRLRIDEYLGDIQQLNLKVDEILKLNTFEKIIWYIRKDHVERFISKGYTLEAIITQYFNGSEAYIVTKYMTEQRRNSQHWVKEDHIISDIANTTNFKTPLKLSPEFTIHRASEHDAEKLSHLYKDVFEIYPTPLNSKTYIKKIIRENSIFYYIKKEDEIVSAASADVNYQYNNAELTDCATLPSYRKHGFMKILLQKLEKELIKQSIFYPYSIARSLSYGMNSCFYQLGYKYSGRLVNNCYIFDKLEDMNVWVKDLTPSAENSAGDA
ncbi:putative beta-lysine N-acetyltransferase [Litchfieldia alkalitelluris]|uniref:putative beta-lysine N-acetyltransferase n=1 Tax=Litchfieldia alkalitelluris TaxID=304268 RepID=UPI000998BBF1|nr:putative beta-lysine N-acetyltransferase [Litchfieldia alkalitelluris]